MAAPAQKVLTSENIPDGLHNITKRLFEAVDKQFPEGNDKLKGKVAVAHNNLINKYNAATPEARTAFVEKIKGAESQIRAEIESIKAMTAEEKQKLVEGLIDRVNGVQVPVNAAVAASAPQVPQAVVETKPVA